MVDEVVMDNSYDLDTKEVVKTLFLAPVAAGLTGMAVDVTVTAVSNLPAAVITGAQAPLYAALVGAVVFGLTIVTRLDKMLI